MTQHIQALGPAMGALVTDMGLAEPATVLGDVPYGCHPVHSLL